MASEASHTPSRGHFSGFDLLRILAAAGVVVSHSYALTGHHEPVVLGWAHSATAASLGSVSVDVFFATSGYLVAASWYADPRWRAYAMRRAARIWPGLLTMLVLVVGIVGPLTTSDRLWKYASSPMTTAYALGNALLYPVKYELPGVFDSNPFPSVNGSLWTLRIELTAYIILGGLGVVGVLRRRWMMPTLAVIGALAAWLTGVHPLLPAYVGTLPTYATLDLLALFAGGAVMHRVRVRGSGALIALACLVCTRWAPLSFVQYACIPYIVVYLGTRQLRVARALRRLGDPSYGMYIWAFPLQQILVAAQPGISVLALATQGTVCATIAGYVSWHVVESKSMRACRQILARDRPPRVAVVPESA